MTIENWLKGNELMAMLSNLNLLLYYIRKYKHHMQCCILGKKTHFIHFIIKKQDLQVSGIRKHFQMQGSKIKERKKIKILRKPMN